MVKPPVNQHTLTFRSYPKSTIPGVASQVSQQDKTQSNHQAQPVTERRDNHRKGEHIGADTGNIKIASQRPVGSPISNPGTACIKASFSIKPETSAWVKPRVNSEANSFLRSLEAHDNGIVYYRQAENQRKEDHNTHEVKTELSIRLDILSISFLPAEYGVDAGEIAQSGLDMSCF